MQLQKWMKKRMMKESLLALALLTLFSPGAMAERLPLTLDEAVSLALSNNRSIEQALWARESARSQLSEVRRQSGPTLRWSSQARHIGGASYEGSRRQHYTAVAQHRAYELGLVSQDADPSQYPLYNNEFSNSVSLSIPLYTGGRLEHQREARGYALNAADLTVENRRQEVRYNTRAAYYRALQYRDLIGVRQETIKALQEHCNQVGLQLEVGNVAYYDLLATEVQLENARFSLVEAEGNYKKALHSLVNLLGLPPRTELELQESPAYQHYGAALEDCLDYALTYRPDGIASEYDLKQARAAREAAKSGWRPTVTATLTESRAGEDAFKKNHSQSWSAGIGLEWNVFDNGVTAAQVRTAEAALRTAESRAAQTKETIALEVENAYIDLASAEQNIATSEKAVQKAEEEYRIALVRYTEGVDTNLAVMDAQEKLTEARTKYYAAFYGASSAKAALDKAMGIPVYIDAPVYAAEVEAGKSAGKALSAAALDEAAGKQAGKVRPAAVAGKDTGEAGEALPESPADVEKEMVGK